MDVLNHNKIKAKEYWLKEAKIVIEISEAIMKNNKELAKELRSELKALKLKFKPYRKDIDLLVQTAIKTGKPIKEL